MKKILNTKKITMMRLISSILAVVIVFTCIPFPAKAGTGTVPEIGDAENIAEQAVILNDGTIEKELPISVNENKKGNFENLAFGESNSFYMSVKVDATYDSHTSDVRLIVGRMQDGSTIEIGMRPCTAYPDGQFTTGTWQSVIWKSAAAGAEGEPLAVAGGVSAPAGSKNENNVCTANYTCTIEYNAGKISMWIDNTQIFNKEDISSKADGMTLQLGFHAYEALNVTISEVKIWGDVEDANVADTMIVENNGKDDTEVFLSSGKVATSSNTKGMFKNMKFGTSNNYWMTTEVNGTYEAEQDDLRLVIGKMPDGSTVEIGMRPCTAYTTGFVTGTWQAIVWKTTEAGQEGNYLYVKGDCNAPNNSKVENNVCKATYNCTVKYDNGKISLWIDGKKTFDNVDVSAELQGITLQPGFHAYGLDGTLSNIKIWGDVEAIHDEVLPVIGASQNAAYGMTVYKNGEDVTKEYEDSVEREVGTNQIKEDTGKIDVADGAVITYGELKFGTTKTYYYSADVDTDATAWNSVRMTLGYGMDSDGNKRTIQVCARPTDGANWQTVIFMQRQDGDESYIEESITYITPPSSLVSYRYTVKYTDGKVSFWLNSTPLLKDIKVSDMLSDIVLTPGFYAQGKAATISNIDIWGDVEATREFAWVDPDTIKPVINNATNAALGMTVNNNGLDYTKKYEATEKIVAETEAVGSYGKLKFGDTNTYNYSMEVATDSTSWNAIRMVIGHGKNSDGNKRAIQVCARPTDSEQWQVVVFLRGDNGEEEYIEESIIYIPAPSDVENYTYTIKYVDGLLSFWLDETFVLNKLNVKSTLNDIVLAPGFYAQGKSATISNIDIWGDVEATRAFGEVDPDTIKPVINDATNAALGMTVNNNGLDYTRKYEATEKIIAEKEAVGSYGELKFGDTNTYNYSMDIQTDAAPWDAIRMVIGYGKNSDGNKRAIQVCARPTDSEQWQVVVFLRGDNGEEGYIEESITYIPAPTDAENYTYTIKYVDGLLSFWLDDTFVLNKIDVKSVLSDIVLAPGFYAQGKAATISNIDIWGDVEATREFGEVDPDTIKPVIGEATDAAHGMTVNNNGLDYTKKYEEKGKVVVEKEAVGSYGELKFGATNTYNYSMDIKTDTTSWNAIRMVIGHGKNTDGNKRTIQVCVRPTDDEQWQAVVFLRGENGEEGYIEESIIYIPAPTNATNYTYTVKYVNGFLSFWLDDTFVLNKIDVTSVLSDIVLEPGFYAQGKAATISNIHLWGDVEATREFGYVDPETVEPTIGSAANVADTMIVMNNGVNETTKYRKTKKINVAADTIGTFSNLKFKANSYYYSANVNTTKDHSTKNGSVAYGSLRLRVGYGVNSKNSEQTIEVCIRPELGHAVIFLYGEEEIAVDVKAIPNLQFNQKYRYTIKAVGDKLSFWLDGTQIFKEVVISLKDIQYAPGFYSQFCEGTISNIKLWGEGIEAAPKVPEKPESNGNYADDMYIKSNAVVNYENGILSTNTHKYAETAIFEYLPFNVDDTYVFGFDVTVNKAVERHHSPRIIIGTDTNGNDIAIFFTENAIMLMNGSELIKQISYQRKLGQSYRFDILVEPNAVSLWVDDVLLLEQCKTPNKATTKTGVLFEFAETTMSNFDLYYTDLVKYVKPEVPEKPVLKKIGANQYNAAEWMQVYLGDKLYQGYFNNQLTCTDSSQGVTYLFDSMPITDDMSYYYTATYKITESSAVHQGPRFIFRYSDTTPMYVAITQEAVVLLAGPEGVVSAPFESKVGSSHDIAIYSTPNAVTVWIDGVCLMENVDLSTYCHKGVLKAKMGILFEMCQAKITNLAIYGDKIKFDPAYVDAELYNDKFYRMNGIPAMGKNGVNLFENITMVDNSSGSLGAAYDKEKRILTTEYNTGVGELVFIDAKGSLNLNGLKNKTGYVFSFKYAVEDCKADDVLNTGMWITLGRSDTPNSAQRTNELRVGITGGDLIVQVYEENQVIYEQKTPFARKNGRTYDIAIVHGVTWIKVYVDNQLQMVSTKLPTYDVKFALNVYNTKMKMSDIQLYEFEDSGLTVRETVNKATPTKSGTTIYDTKEHVSVLDTKAPLLLITMMSTLIMGSILGIVLLLLKNKRNGRQKEEKGNA